MNTTNTCPECGRPIPAESHHQVCPACLMAQALASCTIANETESAPPRVAPPTPEEIQTHFPQFEITECLGRGGMGVVYKAKQKSLDRWVAIKILAPEQLEKFANRFASEAATLAKLNHPNIVTIHDFGQTDGLFYLVMEYIDGVNLRDLLRDGKLDPEQALAVVPPICEALQYAHEKGIVHRDIKPENLLLDRWGRVKIADFGIAALVGVQGEAAGTPSYMAPEQKAGKVDNRADIYALGVVLYEMLTGERPGSELVAPSQKVQIDVRLDEIVLRALEKKPELRYQQASAFRTQVETVTRAMQPVQPVQPGSEAKPASTESPQEIRKQIINGTLFCFLSAAGIASHLSSIQAALGVAAWALLFAIATAIAFYRAGEDQEKLQIARKIYFVNFIGTLTVLGGCILLIPWLNKFWKYILVLSCAFNIAESMVKLLNIKMWHFGKDQYGPLQQEIYDHMTRKEKRELTFRNFMYIVWNLATWFVPIAIVFLNHSSERWIYAVLVLVGGLSAFPVWTKILREGYSGTDWARQRGISSEQVKQVIKKNPPRWIQVTATVALVAAIEGFQWLVDMQKLRQPIRGQIELFGTFGLMLLYGYVLNRFSRQEPG